LSRYFGTIPAEVGRQCVVTVFQSACALGIGKLFIRRSHEKEVSAMGIKGFVMKPFVKRDLAETMREALERK